MQITFDDNKQCTCYREFLEKPEDRVCMKNFKKFYPIDIMTPAIKTHQRLKTAQTAFEYQKIYGPTDNRIELKRGLKDKDNLVLKTRVTIAYRKFFLAVISLEGCKYITQKEWEDQFAKVSHIYVFDINNHEYKK